MNPFVVSQEDVRSIFHAYTVLLAHSLKQTLSRGWLQVLVELSRCAAIAFEHVGVVRRAASCGDFTRIPVYAKHQFFIHQQHQPEAARRHSIEPLAKESKWGPKSATPPGIRTSARDYANPVDYNHPYESMARFADFWPCTTTPIGPVMPTIDSCGSSPTFRL
jgi:hypothetical protein